MNSFLMCLSTNCLLWRIIASTQYEWLTTFLQGGAKISLHYYNAHVCKMFFCFWKLLLLNSALQFTIYNDDTKREKKLAKLICFNCNFKFGEKISKSIRFLFIQYKMVWGFYLEKIVESTYPEIDAKHRDIHTECSKQFKWNTYSYVSGQSRPFWAALKLL